MLLRGRARQGLETQCHWPAGPLGRCFRPPVRKHLRSSSTLPAQPEHWGQPALADPKRMDARGGLAESSEEPGEGQAAHWPAPPPPHCLLAPFGTPRALAPRLSLCRPRLRAAAAQMPVQLAGGGQGTLLSEAGPALLPFFTTRDACALRLVCCEFFTAVRKHPWEDGETVIKGSIEAWRGCFPYARCSNVVRFSPTGGEVRKAPVVDADFVHFEGLRELNMTSCGAVTDAAFVHLRGIHSLEMLGCSSITDAALVHLAGIQRLGMTGCSGITDAAFVHLRGIQLLNISSCRQLTDAAFVHLRGIKTLFMDRCSQPAITDSAFTYLQGIRTLDMGGCTQATITGATLSTLAGIDALCVRGCSTRIIVAALDLELPVPPVGMISIGGSHCAYFPWRKPRAGPW